MADATVQGAPTPTRGPAAPLLRRLPVRGELLVPCASRSGFGPAHARPAGTVVDPGQPLSEGADQSWHTAIAPARGRIVGAATALLLNGRQTPAVRFQPDAEQPADDPDSPSTTTEADVLRALEGALPAQLGAWIDRLRGAGIWADRWTSPDLLGQLHQTLRRPIDTLICNTLDLDPRLPLQAVLAEREAAAMVVGAALLARLTGATRRWVALDRDARPQCLNAVKPLAEAAGMRAPSLLNTYPQANPTLLTHVLTGRPLRPSHLPTDQGVLLLDAAAAVAVGNFVLHDAPALRAPLAVYDAAHFTAHWISAPIGMSLREAFAGVEVAHDGALYGGNPMRDQRLAPDAVVSAGGELTVYAVGASQDVNPNPCVRCGWCVEHCPVNIQPAGLLEAAQHEDEALAERYGLEACIECGLCAYVCPSYLPLLHGIRRIRGEA